jgi:hypothetical protein
MALSPNYGFPEPDNASLVKNGAQDIRALGDSIDSFLFRPFSRNAILNSGCEIAQRGTASVASNASTGQFMTDRWNVYRAVAGATFTRQNTNDTTNLPNIYYCIRAQRNSGNTATNVIWTSQNIETVNSIPFAGKTVTLSFYARAGANYSPTSSLLTVNLVSGTGTDQNALLGYTGSATPINQTATLTTTWQRFTYTGTIAATATQLGFIVYSTPTGTAGANDYYEITGVMLEVGNQASPYAPATPSYATELAACQRYYWRPSGQSTYGSYGFGNASASTQAFILVNVPVTLRSTASLALDYSTLALADSVNTPTAVTALVIQHKIDTAILVLADVASGLTQYRPYRLSNNNSTSGYVGFSAEL